MLFKNKKLESELDLLSAAKDYDGIITKINSLYDGKTIPVKLEKRLAIAYFYKSDYDNSLKHFENIAAREESVENLFNVMTSLSSLKNTDRAREIFNRILKIHRGAKSTGKGSKFLPQLCIPFIRYYYACGLVDAGAYDEALVQLEELKKVYASVKITDDTFLYIRGIPSLGSTLELAKKVCDGQNKDFLTSAFLTELTAVVDSEGVDTINFFKNLL